MQARNTLYKLSLEDLKKELRKLNARVEQKIETQLKICNDAIVAKYSQQQNPTENTHSPPVNAYAEYSALDNLVSYNLNPAKEYISAHANSWSHFTEHQKKEATIDSIRAYQFILTIAENPNNTINDEEIEIFKTRHRYRPYFLASLVLFVIGVTVMFVIPFLLPFSFLGPLAHEFIPGLIVTYVLGVLIPITSLFSYNLTAWIEDQRICNELKTSAQIFFKKEEPIANSKATDSRDENPTHLKL